MMKKVICACLAFLLLFSVCSAEKKIRVDSIIQLGRYEQDNDPENGPEPIDWIVIEVQDGKALLISKYGLDVQPYNYTNTDVTWENCTLRRWLNDDFYHTAFDENEQGAILLSELDNSDESLYNTRWGTTGGNNTKDYVFLLSYAEGKEYFWLVFQKSPKSINRVAPTAYAKENGAYSDDKNKTRDNEAAAGWWLRSPGMVQSRVMVVDYSGRLEEHGVDYNRYVDRPALWLDLSAYQP